jgi:subtilisin family serine protease
MRGVGVLVAVAVLPTMVLLPSAGGHAAETPGGSRPAVPGAGNGFGGTPRTVTLVTGDRVSVTVDGPKVSAVGIAAGEGRSRISFFATQVGGHLRVIPSDALSLLHSGRLDPRLFDVTALVGFGYDDQRKDLPLIVTGGPAAARSRVGGMTGADAVRAVPGGSALRAAKADLPSFWQGLTGGLAARSAAAGLSKVWLDGLRMANLDVSVPLIGAPAAWAAGYTGVGVKVAVVDSGIDSTHPDLAGRVIAAQDFTESGNTLDKVGHGTHVAATIASNDSRYRGVAPDAQLLSAKVCPDVHCSESAMLAGMQWSAEQGAKIINISIGGADTPEQDPLEAAVEDLTARYGVLFAISAGNDGGDQTVESPGSADSAVTVGAVTKTDGLASFSSRGPRRGDAAIKPDITAPGVGIVAARSKDGIFGNPGEEHVTLSGTSMATPHVAGAAAILVQQHPTWTPAQLKAALMGSAKPSTTIGVFAQGAGRVDVAHAIAQSILADPPSVSFGLQPWPHGDDTPITRTVTYQNVGASGVTLNLSLTGGAPAGLFALSASTLTVAAGSSASVTLTSDTRVNIPDANYTGYLVAQAGTARLSTPYAVGKEAERHNVTLHQLDRSGQPTQDFFGSLFDPASGVFLPMPADGETIRVPAGRYAVLCGIYGADSSETMLIEPEVVVDRDLVLTMDARIGRKVSVSVPLPHAVPQYVVAIGDVTSSIGNLTGIVFGEPDGTLYVGSADPGRRSPAVTSIIAAEYTRDGADPVDSPYIAEMMWRERGRMFPGFTRKVTAADLATVHAEHAADGPAKGFLRLTPAWPEGFATPISAGSAVKVPGNRVEYYNTDDGIRWSRTLSLTDVNDPTVAKVLVNPLTRFEGGRQYRERRNVAVYGPGFSPVTSPEGWIGRRGDTFDLVPNVINDQLNWFGVPQPTDTLAITLDRNGQRVFDGTTSAAVDVAPGDARYRLGVELTRHQPSSLSTSVSCVWTFRSGTVRGDHGVPLPLSAVRFLPQLNNQNTAPAGRLWPVPIEVQRQQRSAAGPVRTLVVEASYDDGVTWRHVPVVRHGQNAVAFLNHPAGPGFASLRATSTDSAGNTVNETVIRAYRLG